MTDLSELLERCRAAQGPDRELDEALGRSFGWEWVRVDGAFGYWREPEDFDHFHFDGGLPYFTEDMNAALALVERKLAGWHGDVRFGSWPLHKERDTAVIWSGDPKRRESLFGCGGGGATPALAIICALLTALIQQAKDA